MTTTRPERERRVMSETLYPERYPGLVGMTVEHVASGALRSIVAYRQREEGVVIQLSQVIKHEGATLYNVLARECFGDVPQERVTPSETAGER